MPIVEQRNWFGFPPHPSDILVPMGEYPTDDEVDGLRAAWNKLAACDSRALDMVVQRASRLD